MIFELPDIFFGSHKKRKGITTTAGETVRIYKKGRKSLTTNGFFKKSGDIFFGATSQKRNLSCLPRQERFILAFRSKYRANNRKNGLWSGRLVTPKPVFCVQQQKNTEITVVQIEFLCSASNY